jgi:D-aminopeptidase
LAPGKLNAITDVRGVKVGHVTLRKGANVRTGVTVVVPHGGNVFQEKVPGAIYLGNGFGKLAGYSQVEELGNVETPIVLTNTLSVPAAAAALIDYTLSLPENRDVRSVNPVVGETNDGFLNDIRGRHVKEGHVLAALQNAKSGPVRQGNVGAGTGTVCFGFKGGIGTSSRVLPEEVGGYTVGVLVQSNFGGVLQVAGCPVGLELGKYYLKNHVDSRRADGSCMIVVATDAPLGARNLKRLAKRALLGLARTGGICSNGSGDYVIAFSTAPDMRVSCRSQQLLLQRRVLRNDRMSPLFMAVIEATEEAILNSLVKAVDESGVNGHKIAALPLEKVKEILKKYGRLN